MAEPQEQSLMVEIRQQLLAELQQKLPSCLVPYLHARDGASQLARRLPDIFDPSQVNDEKSSEARAWELAGMFYLYQGRFHEALPIFYGMYDHMLRAQEISGRVHKGTPLVWISDCYFGMGYRSLSKRYLMLTLCEDAISSQGDVDPDRTGSYSRLVWQHGLSDGQFKKYVMEILESSERHPNDCRFPEWILQGLDEDWMTELPEVQESTVYATNRRYLDYLISELGDRTGNTMEVLATYLLSCIPGCRTARRQRSYSTDYDIVCSIEGVAVDFRSEFGRYFVCECKDWAKPTDFSTIAKFCRVLDSTKSSFGILFSRNGISGEGKSVDAERELMKVFQDRGMVIVVINQRDIKNVASGTSFISCLRGKFEKVRLDLKHSSTEY